MHAALSHVLTIILPRETGSEGGPSAPRYDRILALRAIETLAACTSVRVLNVKPVAHNSSNHSSIGAASVGLDGKKEM
jgi:hypothetical protein